MGAALTRSHLDFPSCLGERFGDYFEAPKGEKSGGGMFGWAGMGMRNDVSNGHLEAILQSVNKVRRDTRPSAIASYCPAMSSRRSITSLKRCCLLAGQSTSPSTIIARRTFHRAIHAAAPPSTFTGACCPRTQTFFKALLDTPQDVQHDTTLHLHQRR